MDTNSRHILIAGGTGFLGSELENYFSSKGNEVRILTRSPKRKNEIQWDAKNLGDWITEIEWADVLINLTGKSVNCRYTEENKKLIMSSRVDSTAILCKAIQQADNPPKLWMNASSATFYVHAETRPMTEDDGILGDDFSMNVCRRWEEEFFKCTLNHTRTVALRISLVLGRSGGALPMLRKITRLGMGGRQGSGEQYFSWISLKDFNRALEFIINHEEVVGPINLASPNPVKNAYLMKALRKKMGVPFGIPQAKWMLEIGSRIIGTETELILKSRNVIPERLLEKGFEFEDPNIEDAL
ncbi:MAG: TIGR01777 family oxidoreductase [Crocinitomicaceae bacterium]|nr:TIGR01777 family protein [Crocinitomicaceae bacterium]